MKKRLVLPAVLMLILLCLALPATAEDGEEGTAEWTVMFYLCGTDLGETERLAEYFDRYFKYLGELYATNPERIKAACSYLSAAFEFGLAESSMIDLGGIFYQPYAAGSLDRELYYGMTDALTDAVVYNIHSSGRSGAHGLSFCDAFGFSAEELDIYAKNCPSAHYLAFLDAVIPGWTAPEWVYEAVEPLPDIREMTEYRATIGKRIGSDGVPAIAVENGYSYIRYVYADLYRENPQTGRTLHLGSVVTTMKNDDRAGLIFTADCFRSWPAVEGESCDAELVKRYNAEDLYNIPVLIGTEVWFLRCSRDAFTQELTLHGLWEGYDVDTNTFNRNVMHLSKLAGQEFCLLYPIDGTERNGKPIYETGDARTLYRSLIIEGKPLPAGTYYMEYRAENLFMRKQTVGRVKVLWDGENVTLSPDGAWEGSVELDPPEV